MSDEQKLLLMVEDTPADIALARAALADMLLTHRCLTFCDGASALEYLNDPSNELPDLVLLDLNLPGMDGRELLAEIKGSPRLQHVPVVILTTSNAPRDRAQAYAGHANSFVTKPVDLDDYATMLKSIVKYWFETVTLPDRSAV